MVNFNHLKENNTSYITHLNKAFYIGVTMIIGGFLCCIHALCPFIFTESASKRIKKLYKIL